MRREANAPAAYEDFIRTVGAPNKTVTDNAQVLSGVKWTNINRKYCIETGLTVPHHQHQNYSEGVGGNFKFAILKLFHNTPHATLPYWCFAASFLDKTHRFISQSTLDGRCGYEMIKGKTGDISIFRFSWFEPILFYNPAISFPKDKMEPVFFLDLANNTGDGISYEILPVRHFTEIPLRRNPVTLIRSVVRPRTIGSPFAPSCRVSPDGFKFFNRLGEELFGSEETEPSLPPTDAPLLDNSDTMDVDINIDPILPLDNMKAAHEIADPPTLSKNLFVEEAHNHILLTTSLEEEYCVMNVPQDDASIYNSTPLPNGRGALPTLVDSDMDWISNQPPVQTRL